MVSPQDRPPDITTINEITINEITINEITMESNEMERTHYNVMSRKDLEAEVQTMYKRKDKKVHPANFVKSCEGCQKRSRNRQEEPLHPTWTKTVWDKIGVDVVKLPESSEGHKFAVFARDDLSGWSEGRPLVNADSKSVAKFLFEDVICRHGCPRRIVMDGGSENKKVTKSLLKHYRIKQIDISAYHPQSNGLVERGHDTIVNSLSKYCKNDHSAWARHLPLVLWADRISVRRTTGYSAFELLYGRDCMLPVELSLASWSVVDWEGEVESREDLLLARMRQLDERAVKETRAAIELERSRKGNKAYFDQNKNIRTQPLQVGDLVLLHNTKTATARMTDFKFNDKWQGPYRIREVGGTGYYRLAELDGVELKQSFAGNRLKKFFSRGELDIDRSERHETIRVRDTIDLSESEDEEGEEEEELEMLEMIEVNR